MCSDIKPNYFCAALEPPKLLNERANERRWRRPPFLSHIFLPFRRCGRSKEGRGRVSSGWRKTELTHNVFALQSLPCRSFSFSATLYPVADTFCHLVGGHVQGRAMLRVNGRFWVINHGHPGANSVRVSVCIMCRKGLRFFGGFLRTHCRLVQYYSRDTLKPLLCIQVPYIISVDPKTISVLIFLH